MSFTSRYFQVHEFDCHDGSDYPKEWVDDRLAALCSQLDLIRERWGGPIKIVSGYRTPAWNGRIDGAQQSQHMQGKAADIQPLVMDADRGDRTEAVYRLHEQIWDGIKAGRLELVGGVGYYPGRWCHVDIRPRGPDGHVAHWNGGGVGAEQT